jgi:hypothetical protein
MSNERQAKPDLRYCQRSADSQRALIGEMLGDSVVFLIRVRTMKSPTRDVLDFVILGAAVILVAVKLLVNIHVLNSLPEVTVKNIILFVCSRVIDVLILRAAVKFRIADYAPRRHAEKDEVKETQV